MRDVVLHAFNWNYATITARAKQIAQAGYGAVLFPPILYSKDDGSDWWQRYQPKDYRILRSYLGRKADLDGALKALQETTQPSPRRRGRGEAAGVGGGCGGPEVPRAERVSETDRRRPP